MKTSNELYQILKEMSMLVVDLQYLDKHIRQLIESIASSEDKTVREVTLRHWKNCLKNDYDIKDIKTKRFNKLQSTLNTIYNEPLN